MAHRLDFNPRPPGDLLAEGCLILDFGTRFLYVNHIAALQRGCPAGSMLGRTVEEVFPWLAGSPIFEAAKATLADRIPRKEVVAFPSADGQVRWLDVRLEPVPEGLRIRSVDVSGHLAADAAGPILSLELSGAEPQEALWNLEASELRYRSLFEAMAEGFALQEVILGPDGAPCDSRFLEVNGAFHRLTGHARAEVVGRTAAQALPPSPLWDPALGQVALDGQSLHREVFCPFFGRHFELLAYSPVPGQFAVLFMDITGRKEAEARSQARTEEMQAALEELDAFTYTVSHNLRAPVRHILGFAELFGQERPEALSARQGHYLDTILKASRHMGRLIDELLTFSQSSRAEVRKVRVDLARLVQDCITALEPDLRDRQVVWTVDPLPEVEADPVLLRSVLDNLLDNALKFTRGRNPARIRIGCAGSDRETVVSVADNGAGFNPRNADKLFGVFNRLHGETAFEGSGIGLATVRHIIRRHGGRTWASGEVDLGATFSFSLPKGGPRP